MKSVGLCGAGMMGRHAATALMEAGYRVVVYDVSPQARDRAKTLGAVIADNPAAVIREVETVLMSLPGPNEVRNCVVGTDGLLKGGARGKTIVDLSTVDPTVSVHMSEAAEQHEIAYLDAPVLGRPDTVGRWVFPVGGSSEAIETVRPVLQVLSSRICPTGPVGSGNKIKLLNQLMSGAINAITGEVMAIASEMGVPHKVLYETIAGSEAVTVSKLFVELSERIVNDHYSEPTFTVDLMLKDVRLAADMARDCGAPPVLTRSVEFINETAQTAGLGGYDTAVLWKGVRGLWQKANNSSND